MRVRGRDLLMNKKISSHFEFFQLRDRISHILTIYGRRLFLRVGSKFIFGGTVVSLVPKLRRTCSGAHILLQKKNYLLVLKNFLGFFEAHCDSARLFELSTGLLKTSNAFLDSLRFFKIR